MILNQTNIRKLGYMLLSYNITPAQYSGEAYWNSGAYSPTLIKGQYTFLNLELEIYFEGESSAEVEQKKSKLNALMENPTIILEEVDREIEYLCVFEGQASSTKIDEYATIVSYKFKAFKRGLLKEVILSSTSNNIEITTDVTTEAIYEITPKIDMIEITIHGIKIKNLKANKKIIIDGVKKTVTMDGKNKFGDTEFWSFPVLTPGTNKITLSRTDAKVIIKYYPRYV